MTLLIGLIGETEIQLSKHDSNSIAALSVERCQRQRSLIPPILEYAWTQKLDHDLRCMCDGLRACPLPTKWTRGAGHPVGQPPYWIPKG